MRVYLTPLLLLLAVTSVFARPTNTGYSGAPGSQGTCASSCHGVTGGTVQVFGFPSAYTPGEQYLITIRKLSGSSIKNFNSSIRRGSAAQNAGTITAGLRTGTYNVQGETNGVHMTTLDHDSATFHWTAPAAGTGTVRLYLGAHQGDRNTGPNTARVLVATEAPSLPGVCTAPQPANGQNRVEHTSALSWTAGNGATSHDVYTGTDSSTLTLQINQTATTFVPASAWIPGQTVYWRVDERNTAGATTGPIWRFTVRPLPGMAVNPNPAHQALDVEPLVTLSWQVGAETDQHDLYFGTTNPPPLLVTGHTGSTYELPEALSPATVFYWRVDERNPGGITTGTLWQFQTADANGTGEPATALPRDVRLGTAYPNPFNAVVSVPFTLPQAMPVDLTVYDIHGRAVATLLHGSLGAGMHEVQWSSAGFGSGLYLLRLTAAGKTMTTKIVALK